MKDELGPLVALIVAILLTLGFGVGAYQNHQELTGGEDPSQSQDEKIKAARAEVDSMRAEAETLEAQIVNLRKEILKQQGIYQYNMQLKDSYTEEYTRRQKLLESLESFEKGAGELHGKVSTLKQETLQKIQTENAEVRDKMDREVQEKTAAREAALERVRVLEQAYATDKSDHIRNLSFKQSQLSEDTSILQDLTQRDIERADVFAHADGKVVHADPITNVIIIDVGSGAGVKNGYRFECYAMRPGNRKILKGYLEVRRAEPSKSICMLVQRPTALPRDPLSEYVAGQPEELYSPYQTVKDGGVQPLVGTPKMVKPNAEVSLDPIVEGDLVQNPFFQPNKTFTYYITSHEKRSYIRYSKPQVAAVIEQYGGKVSEKVDINVNYVIAQRNPKEDPQYAKIKDLGLPVMYEWELFRFLENR